MRLSFLIVLAVGILLARGAGADIEAGSAGASTFESGKQLYRSEPFRPEDVVIPKVDVPEAEASESEPSAPSEEQGTSFPIERYEVAGNTLLTEEATVELLVPFTGERKTLADIQAARDALQAAYEALGLLTVAVTIPAQTVDSGRVRLQVVEARIGRVAVENPGVDWFSEAFVRARTPHLEPGALMRSEELQADLQRVNANADLRVRPTVKGGEEAGTVDVTLRVDDRIPLHGGFTLANDRSAGSPNEWLRLEASYTNLWALEHQIGISYQISPFERFEDVQIVAGTYQAPMPWSRRQSLFFYTVYSDTTNGITDAPGLSVLGNGLNVGARYRVELPGVPNLPGASHALTLAIDRKDIENSLESGGIAIKTPVTYLPFGAEWSGNLVGGQGFLSTQIGLSAHVAGTLPGGDRDDFQKNRPDDDVTGDFAIGSFGLQTGLRLASLKRLFEAGRFVTLPERPIAFGDDAMFLFRSRGQIASEPLISTEQFAGGGLESVRGYLRSEYFGDDGWNGQFELTTPMFRGFAGGRLREGVQAIAFYDVAALHLRNAGEGQDTWQTLQSWGGGLRLRVFDALRGELFVSRPVDTTVNTTGKSTQFTFQIGAAF